jgi:hypothetical protein
VRLSQVRLRAEEIVGGFPQRDHLSQIPWWPLIAGLVVTVLLVIRRRQSNA